MQPNVGTNPRAKARTLKNALYAGLWLALLALASSCATALRCADKFPCTPVDTIITTQVTYRDTTIYRDLPPVVIVDSVPYATPCADSIPQRSDTVKVAAELADAKAWIAAGALHLALSIHGQRLAFKLDSAMRLAAKETIIYKERAVEVKVIPPFYRACLYVSIILIVLFLAIIFIALRL